MLNSDVLEVAIGLVFIYLLLSLIATSAREALEGLLKTRSKSLEGGLVELFDATRQPQLLQAFYDQPLISALYRGDYALPAKLTAAVADATKAGTAAVTEGAAAVQAAPAVVAKRVAATEAAIFGLLGRASANETAARQAVASTLPSYIPPSSFALAVLDMVARRDPAVSQASADVVAAATDAAKAATPMTMAVLQAAANDLIEGTFADAMRLAIKTSTSVEEVQSFLEDWFNGAMDRVSGIYRRYTQAILLVLSAVICILLNVNTVVIAQSLAQNPTLRATVAADATGAASNPDFTNAITSTNAADASQAINTQVGQIERVEGLPIGWGATAQHRLRSLFPGSPGQQPFQTFFVGLEVLAGWLITAFAIMLGAPFWFDVLGKIMVVRSTVKPAEKSGIEASKDAT